MLSRTLEAQIRDYLFQGRVVTLFGARRTGKTTLVRSLLEHYVNKRTRYINCDLQSVQSALSVADAEPLRAYLGDQDLVVLDEAQNIRTIGQVLKILVDTYPAMQVIATGSSSFDLANQTGEPLTGRVYPFTLYPFSLQEVAAGNGYSVLDPRLERFLRFGLYPSLIDADDAAAERQLDELVANYLYKDILSYVGVKRSSVITNLVRVLALQVGNEVSYAELASTLGIDRKTVIAYIDLLEQSFVVFRLGALSRNLRKEVAKSIKIYFFDVGVRNAILQSFAPLSLRTDAGALWENFCIAERIKYTDNNNIRVNRYFWRTYDQKEIDYVEERNGVFTGYEYKWNPQRSARIPALFTETYPGSSVVKIDPSNYWRYYL
jgi:predicted AAA+ superfamily ATPase